MEYAVKKATPTGMRDLAASEIDFVAGGEVKQATCGVLTFGDGRTTLVCSFPSPLPDLIVWMMGDSAKDL